MYQKLNVLATEKLRVEIWFSYCESLLDTKVAAYTVDHVSGLVTMLIAINATKRHGFSVCLLTIVIVKCSYECSHIITVKYLHKILLYIFLLNLQTCTDIFVSCGLIVMVHPNS